MIVKILHASPHAVGKCQETIINSLWTGGTYSVICGCTSSILNLMLILSGILPILRVKELHTIRSDKIKFIFN